MSSQRKLTQPLQTPSDRHSVVFRFDYDVADKVKPTTMVLTSSTKGANGYVHKRTTVKAENRFTATDDEVPQLDFSSTGTDSDSGATSDRQSVPISSLNETESRMNVSTGFTNDRRSGRKRKPTNPDKVQSALKKRCETNSDVADSPTATSPSSTVSDDQVSDSSRTSSSASSSLDILSRVSTTRRPNRAIATTVYRTCQSCKRKTSFAHLVPINTHHHINPFMNTSRRYAVTLPDYLDPNTKNSLAQRLTLGSSSMATPNATKSAINNKPYTSFIPVESVLMCETCAIAFRKHRRQCDTCLFVPAMEERHNRDCTRCFEGVISLS